jgi:hypothetical protein
MRWHEEVLLVREEMRRTSAFFDWHNGWWKRQIGQRDVTDDALRDGLTAYANRQAALRQALGSQFAYLWRLCSSWTNSAVLPKGRRWYHEVIQPHRGPSSIFSEAVSSCG